MICPSCKNEVSIKENNLECRFCGAFTRINIENGYVEWIKEDRVILNEQLERESWEIWKKAYPEQFGEAELSGKKPRTEDSI